MVLAIHPIKALADDIGIPENGSGFSGITISYNARSEKEVDEVLDKVKTLGMQILKPAQKVYWGGYSGYFLHDRHIFEVAYNPFWEMDDNDNLNLPV